MTPTTGRPDSTQGQQTPPTSARRTSSAESPSSTVEPRIPSQTFGHKRRNTPNFDPSVNAKPFSPFYRHATPNFSADKLEPRVRCEAVDPEAGDSQDPQQPPRAKLWEKKRRCLWWRRLNRGTRLVLEIALGILIIGGMVGIALGIAASVSGGGKK